jgi:hypothetical protein
VLGCTPQPGLGSVRYERSKVQHVLDLGTCRDRVVETRAPKPTATLTSRDGRYRATVRRTGRNQTLRDTIVVNGRPSMRRRCRAIPTGSNRRAPSICSAGPATTGGSSSRSTRRFRVDRGRRTDPSRRLPVGRTSSPARSDASVYRLPHVVRRQARLRGGRRPNCHAPQAAARRVGAGLEAAAAHPRAQTGVGLARLLPGRALARRAAAA